MKERIIEAAGKTWRFLGQNGQINVSQLAKVLKEKDEVVLQALGWLAREDKIDYTVKNRRTFVSLVEGELRAFNTTIYNINERASSAKGSDNGKLKAKK
jgi:Mn-dependent DtxR family transcriptional regulator